MNSTLIICFKNNYSNYIFDGLFKNSDKSFLKMKDSAKINFKIIYVLSNSASQTAKAKKKIIKLEYISMRFEAQFDN